MLKKKKGFDNFITFMIKISSNSSNAHPGAGLAPNPTISAEMHFLIAGKWLNIRCYIYIISIYLLFGILNWHDTRIDVEFPADRTLMVT